MVVSEQKFLLLRLFSKDSYAYDFLSGKMRMMPLSYYRKIEDDGHGRKDKYEGTELLWQGQCTTIKIGDYEITGKDGLKSIVLRTSAFEETTKINCFTLLPVREDGSFDMGHIPYFKLPYCVVFTNPDELIRRFRNAALGMDYGCGKVSFYNPDTYNGYVNAYMKPDSYKWQHEYRFSVVSDTSDPFILELGDLSDIAQIHKTEDFTQTISRYNVNSLSIESGE